MPKDYNPNPHTLCSLCRKPIGNEEYYYTKTKGYPPVFVHKKCYDELPKMGKAKGGAL